MNGRIQDDGTPEGRLAAVARSLAIQMEKQKNREPDYADFREALRPFVRRELLLVRIDEARKVSGIALTERMKQLSVELMELERTLPDPHRL